MRLNLLGWFVWVLWFRRRDGKLPLHLAVIHGAPVTVLQVRFVVAPSFVGVAVLGPICYARAAMLRSDCVVVFF